MSDADETFEPNPALPDKKRRYLHVLSQSSDRVPNLVVICQQAGVSTDERMSKAWTQDPLFVEDNRKVMKRLEQNQPTPLLTPRENHTAVTHRYTEPRQSRPSKPESKPKNPRPWERQKGNNTILPEKDFSHPYEKHREEFLTAMKKVQCNPDKACEMLGIPNNVLTIWARDPDVRADINQAFRDIMGVDYKGDLLMDRWLDSKRKEAAAIKGGQQTPPSITR